MLKNVLDIERLSEWDIAVLVLYFILIMAISIMVSNKFSEIKNETIFLSITFKSVYGKKRNTVDSYFLAGRNMNWILVKKE